ncbi:MAG: hypothetical protein ACTSUQ_06060, partial [Candidatus Freyarchaeota archaeon]
PLASSPCRKPPLPSVGCSGSKTHPNNKYLTNKFNIVELRIRQNYYSETTPRVWGGPPIRISDLRLRIV